MDSLYLLRTANPLSILFPPEEWQVHASDTALLIVDMQYLDAHPDWGIGLDAKRRGLQTAYGFYKWEQLTQVIPRIRRLEETCRSRGVEVIHLRIASLTQNCRDSSRGHHLRGCLAPPASKEAQILEELGPNDDEVTISKTSSSPFSSTAIDQILQNLGIRNLIACGVATSSCVQMTVRDAADRSYGVLVVHDACTAVSEEMHQAALLTMEGFMGLVRLRSTDEVVRLLEKLPLGAEHSTASTQPDSSARQEDVDRGHGSNT